MRSLLGQVRPDRQTLLFSATMPRKVEALVRDAVSEPVRITIGGAGANEDIRQVCILACNTEHHGPSLTQKRCTHAACLNCLQVVEVVAANDKLQWLLTRLPGFIDAGDVLVFANQKAHVDDVTAKLQAAGFKCAPRHPLPPSPKLPGLLTSRKITACCQMWLLPACPPTHELKR